MGYIECSSGGEKKMPSFTVSETYRRDSGNTRSKLTVSNINNIKTMTFYIYDNDSTAWGSGPCTIKLNNVVVANPRSTGNYKVDNITNNSTIIVECGNHSTSSTMGYNNQYISLISFE